LAMTPQPIADAINQLGSNTSATELQQDIKTLSQTIAHYLGVISLACQAKLKNYQKEKNHSLAEVLQKLYRQNLTGQEWILLAKELCSPFSEEPETFPIPELVSLFFDCPNNTPTQIIPLFQKLLAKPITLRIKNNQEGNSFQSLIELFSAIKSLLLLLKPIFQYQLFLPRESHNERWTGTNRVCLIGSKLENKEMANKPLLADANDKPVLSLWPLAQVRIPALGSRLELFSFAGKGAIGAKFVALPYGFEFQDEDFWNWFQEDLLYIDSVTQNTSLSQRQPYPGLSAFTFEDSDLFFGREQEIQVALNKLRRQALLAIVGPSGAGKSSFVQAGIIPNLPQGWRTITFRPGSSPIISLKLKLIRELKLSQDLASGNIVHELQSFNAEGLVIIVDQFEEIITLCDSEQKRELFCKILAELTNSLEQNIRVIITLRDDFLVKAKALPFLGEQLTQSLEILTTPSASDLIRILVEPAKYVLYQFEDHMLPKEIAESVIGKPSALPLLAFTAAKLWQLRDLQTKRLTRKAYLSIGGVGGALASHAELLVKELSLAEQKLLREMFRRLVTSEGTKAVLNKNELLQILGDQSIAEPLIEKIVIARLVSVSKVDGIEKIEIIHEALLSSWPRLVNWLHEDIDVIRLRDQLQSAARQWQDRGKPKGLLWRDEALTEYELWRNRYSGNLSNLEQAFAQASLFESTRNKKRQQLVIALIMSSLVIGVMVLFWQRQEAAKNAREANIQVGKLYEEQGRQELLAQHPNRALPYLSKAYSSGNNSASLRFMLAQSLKELDKVKVLIGHNDWVTMASFNKDNSKVLTAS
ncbi:MAG: serine/threonine protein kinase with WD40 repeat, partial [bacterium]